MRADTDADLIARIIATLQGVIYLPVGSITESTRLDDLGLDSLDLVEAGLELEAIFGRDVTDEAFVAVETVGDLAAHLAGHPVRPALSRAA